MELTASPDTDSSKLSQKILIQRVQQLEDHLSTAKAEAARALDEAATAKEAQQIAEHKASQAALDVDEIQTRLKSKHAEELERLQTELNTAETVSQATITDLVHQLDLERQRNSCLMKSLENEGKAQQATRELAAHVGDLERRNTLLRKKVEAKTTEAEELGKRAMHAEELAEKLTTAEYKANEAVMEAQAYKAELRDAQQQLEAGKKLMKAQSSALHDVVQLLSSTMNTPTHSREDDATYTAVAMARAVCTSYASLASALKVAQDGDGTLQASLEQQRQECQKLAAELLQARTALINADSRLTEHDAVVKQLESCKSELEECRHAKANLEVIESRLRATEQRAVEAEAKLTTLQDGAESRDERVLGLRQATAAALKEASLIKQGITAAVLDASRQLQSVESQLVLKAQQSNKRNNDTTSTSDGDQLNSALVAVLESASSQLSSVDEITDSDQLVHTIASGLEELCVGYTLLPELLEERNMLYKRLVKALSSLTGDDDTDSNLPTSVVDLAQVVIDKLVSAVSTLKTDKRAAEKEKKRLRKDTKVLESQLQSLHAATQAVLDHAGVDERATLEALAMTQKRASDLEIANAELRSQAEQTHRATQRDWSKMRSDMETIVRHAEQAQQEAESALLRQQEEAASLAEEALSLREELNAMKKKSQLPDTASHKTAAATAITPEEESDNEDISLLKSQLASSLRRCEDIESRKRLESASKERTLLSKTHDLRCQLAEARSELAATRSEAVAAEKHNVYLELQLRQALDLAKQHADALDAVRDELNKDKQRLSDAITAAEDASIIRQQLAVYEQKCQVLEAKLEAYTGVTMPEGVSEKTSRLLRRYRHGMAALRQALVQLDSTTEWDTEEGDRMVNEAPEKLVDAVLLHLHKRDMDITSLTASLKQLEGAMREQLQANGDWAIGTEFDDENEEYTV